MKKIFKYTSILALTFFLPLVVFAQEGVIINNPVSVSSCAGNQVEVLLCNIQSLLNSIVPILITLGVVYFVWGVVQYFIFDSEEAKKKGRERMIYGIIGLAIIISLWGIVTLVTETLGIGRQSFPVAEVSNLVSAPPASSNCPDLSVGSPKVSDYLNYATCVIGSSVIPFLFALAVVMFIWGAVKFFIINADEEQKRAQGKQFMIWGIIALTVMLCVWGLVHILGATFHVNTDVLPRVCPPGDAHCR